MENAEISPFLSLRIIFISGENSASTCLHMPQGNVRPPPEEVMAIAVNSRCPSETALKTAVRSAQLVAPYVEFSMLQPV